MILSFIALAFTPQSALTAPGDLGKEGSAPTPPLPPFNRDPSQDSEAWGYRNFPEVIDCEKLTPTPGPTPTPGCWSPNPWPTMPTPRPTCYPAAPTEAHPGQTPQLADKDSLQHLLTTDEPRPTDGPPGATPTPACSGPCTCSKRDHFIAGSELIFDITYPYNSGTYGIRTVTKGRHYFLTVQRVEGGAIRLAGYVKHPDRKLLQLYYYIQDEVGIDAHSPGHYVGRWVLYPNNYRVSVRANLYSLCGCLKQCKTNPPVQPIVDVDWSRGDGGHEIPAIHVPVTGGMKSVVQLWDGIFAKDGNYALDDSCDPQAFRRPPNNYNIYMHTHKYFEVTNGDLCPPYVDSSDPSYSIQQCINWARFTNRGCQSWLDWPAEWAGTLWGHNGDDGGWKELNVHDIFQGKTRTTNNHPTEFHPDPLDQNQWDICTGEVWGTPCQCPECPPPARFDPTGNPDGLPNDPALLLQGIRSELPIKVKIEAGEDEADYESDTIYAINKWNEAAQVTLCRPLFEQDQSTNQFSGVVIRPINFDEYCQIDRRCSRSSNGQTYIQRQRRYSYHLNCSGVPAAGPPRLVIIGALIIIHKNGFNLDYIPLPSFIRTDDRRYVALHELGHVIFGIGHADHANERYNEEHADNPVCSDNIRRTLMCGGHTTSLQEPTELDVESLKCLYISYEANWRN